MMLKNYSFNLSRYIKTSFSFESNTKIDLFWSKIFLFGISLAFFLSVLLQAPVFVNLGLNTITLFLWIGVLLLALILDYKLLITWLFNYLIFLIPFVLYCLVGIFFKLDYFSSSFFRMIIQAVVLLVLGSFCRHKFTIFQLKFCGYIFCLSCFILATIVYAFTILPSIKSILSPTYIYSSKNSTAPILFTSSIVAFFLRTDKFGKIVSILYSLYVLAFIFIVRCRTVLIAAPFVYFYLLYKFGGFKAFIITITIVFLLTALIFLIPKLNDLIIQKMILNGKNNLDAIFSGRLSLIAENISRTQFFFFSPSFYVDCMPILIIINQGVFGLLLLVPLIALPLLVAIKIRNKKFKSLAICLCITFYINSLLEGYGMFGPGNKTLFFWLFFGFCFTDIFSSSTANNRLFSTAARKIENVPERWFFAIVLLFATIVASAISGISKINYSFSTDIMFRLDSSSKGVNYIYPEKLEFASTNRTVFFEGQSYSFDIKVFPENSTDKALHPLAWNVGEDMVSFDVSDKVTAHFHKEGSFTLDVFSEKVKTEARLQKAITIKKAADFVFDDINIWTVDGCDLNLKINQAKNIFFDHNYIPNLSYLSFYSTDESVAIVDHGKIEAVGPGQCQIYARGFNNKGLDSNLISVNVSSDYLSLPSTIDCLIDNYEDLYTDTDYSLTVSFDDDITDDFEVIINDALVSVNASTISFNKKSNNVIIRSVSNPEVAFKVMNFEAKQLEPLRFVAGKNNWIKKQNGPRHVDLYLEYNDSSIRSVNSNDLFYSFENFKNRASKLRSGIIGNDGLLFYPLKSGESTLQFVGKENQNITFSLTVTASSFSKQEFYTLSKNIGFMVASLLLSLIFLIYLLADSRKKGIFFAVALFCLFTLAFVVLLSGGLYWLTLLCVFIYFCINICVLIIVSKIKKKYRVFTLISNENTNRFDSINLLDKKSYREISV